MNIHCMHRLQGCETPLGTERGERSYNIMLAICSSESSALKVSFISSIGVLVLNCEHNFSSVRSCTQRCHDYEYRNLVERFKSAFKVEFHMHTEVTCRMRSLGSLAG